MFRCIENATRTLFFTYSLETPCTVSKSPSSRVKIKMFRLGVQVFVSSDDCHIELKRIVSGTTKSPRSYTNCSYYYEKICNLTTSVTRFKISSSNRSFVYLEGRYRHQYDEKLLTSVQVW
jgi:hypothetical protein